MLARQLTPIETSSPVGVDSPLWQAMHRSDVSNSAFEPPLVDASLRGTGDGQRSRSERGKSSQRRQRYHPNPFILSRTAVVSR